MNVGLKVVIDNKQLNSKETRDYSIWSKYSVMKTFRVVTIGYTFSSDVASVTLSIPHGLKYRPACWVSFTEATHTEWNNFDQWDFFYLNGADKALRHWEWFTTLDQIQIKYREDGVAGGGVNPTGEQWEFKLYIFVDPIG